VSKFEEFLETSSRIGSFNKATLDYIFIILFSNWQHPYYKDGIMINNFGQKFVTPREGEIPNSFLTMNHFVFRKTGLKVEQRCQLMNGFHFSQI